MSVVLGINAGTALASTGEVPTASSTLTAASATASATEAVGSVAATPAKTTSAEVNERRNVSTTLCDVAVVALAVTAFAVARSTAGTEETEQNGASCGGNQTQGAIERPHGHETARRRPAHRGESRDL